MVAECVSENLCSSYFIICWVRQTTIYVSRYPFTRQVIVDHVQGAVVVCYADQ